MLLLFVFHTSTIVLNTLYVQICVEYNTCGCFVQKSTVSEEAVFNHILLLGCFV